jgi:hypothetical protein
MIRVLLVATALLVAVVLNRVLNKRTIQAPMQADPAMPTQVDRTDFSEPGKEWLVLAFTSSTCNTCADIERKAVVLKSTSVAVEICEYTAHRQLHKKYSIEAVPTLLIADDQGIVRKGFLGPASATDIWAALARVREDLPDPHEGDCS